jgi:hypothetical protein
MIDDSVLTISAGTRLRISEYLLNRKTEERNSLLSLVRGKLRAIIAKLPVRRSNYRIETLTAVMGVRGTFFVTWLKVDPNTGKKTSWLLVLEGAVEASNQMGSVLVTEGMMCKVPDGEPPSEPWSASPKEIEEALEGTELDLVPGETFFLNLWSLFLLEILLAECPLQEPLVPHTNDLVSIDSLAQWLDLNQYAEIGTRLDLNQQYHIGTITAVLPAQGSGRYMTYSNCTNNSACRGQAGPGGAGQAVPWTGQSNASINNNLHSGSSQSISVRFGAPP